MGRLESWLCSNRLLSGALVVVRLFLAASQPAIAGRPHSGLGIGWAVIA